MEWDPDDGTSGYHSKQLRLGDGSQAIVRAWFSMVESFFKSKLFGEANQFDYRSFIYHQACNPGLDPGSRLLEMNQPEIYTEVGYTLKYLED